MKYIILGGKHGVGKHLIVDDSDFEVASKIKWSVDSVGYPQGRYCGKTIRLHNLLLGKSNRKNQIDHINRNKLDNRRSNLRIVTQKENLNNTDRNVFITAFNETKTLSDWQFDKRCSVSYVTIVYRIKMGLSVEEAISKPTNVVDIDDQIIYDLVKAGNSFASIGRKFNLNRRLICYRFHRYENGLKENQS
jgi:hypothetical protein